jgi:hypothetical protein
MPVTEFPLPTRVAPRIAYDLQYATPAALLASTEAARGAGVFWHVSGADGDHRYQELASGASDPDLITAGGVKLRVVPEDRIYKVDAFGAQGDGVTDDTAALQRAFDGTPDFGVLQFSSGKTYLVSARIESKRGRSITVIARGATIKCADDSVWHVFKLGGVNEDNPAQEIRWYGGTFDGNLANQRYFPSMTTIPENATFWNGTRDPLAGYTVFFTDLGMFATNDGGVSYKTWDRDVQENVASAPKHALKARVGLRDHDGPVGTLFYENSPVNGATWNNDWLTGRAEDGIDVNGGGNEGLIQIGHAQRAVFEDIHFTRFVRNGAVTWNVKEVHATRIRGSEQLPTAFFELNSTLGQGQECALMKFSGFTDNSIVSGNYTERVHVSDCIALGGAMPLFVRTNEPKPPASGTVVLVDRCQFYGIAREAWFEICQSVTISDSHITCADYPASLQRANTAIFIGKGPDDWTIANSYVHGRVDTEGRQLGRSGSIVNSVLTDYSQIGQRPLMCETIAGSYIESRSGGVLANRISGSELYLEMPEKPGSESFKVEALIANSTVGKERFQGTRERLVVQERDNAVILSGQPDAVVRVLVRNRRFHGGRWFAVDSNKYSVSGNKLSFVSDNLPMYAVGDPVDVEVEWYAERLDTFTITAARERAHTLTRTGGTRTEDVRVLRYDGVDVPHRYEVNNLQVDPHWTSAMNADGRMVVTLQNIDPTPNATLVVRYRPPLAPYQTLVLGSGETVVDIIGRNFEGIVTEGGSNRISGTYSDIEAPAFLRFKDGTQLVEIDGARIERMSGGLLCGINSQTQCREGRVVNSYVGDWMLAYPRLAAPGAEDGAAVVNDRAIGCIRSVGTMFTRAFQVTGVTMAHTGRQTGASKDPGRNQAAELRNGVAASGGNLYLGGVSSVNAAGHSSSSRVSLPDGV